MSDERWSRIEARLDEALDLAPGEIPAWLERQDSDLRDELAALLRAHAASEGFLETPAAEAAVDLAAEEGDDPAPEPVESTIGPYRILGELGRGGMGVVYLARREDVDKEVALKLLPRELSSRRTIRRFLAERRVLARLEHPNIARLLDAGIAPSGLPYFALERVEGERIDHWCEERSVGVEERLRLFTDVCRAVEHAHRKAVIHRDLKPSNVLVDGDGQVKLLDFGIAKVLEEEEVGDATVTHFLTPQYASPEQFRGEAVDTATDVYSLGVLLYGLLSGRPPYDVGSCSLFEAGRIVLESDVLPPSAVAVDRHRSQRLRGDLDGIVQEAMRKEVARRYESVAALREDVERHLAGLPVRARGDSVGYRAGRFLRRNWVGVGLSAAVLLASAAAVTFHLRSVAEERDRARLEAAKAQRVTEFLQDLLTATDPDMAPGEDPTATDLLERGAARIRGELDQEPEVKAMILDTLGEVLRKRGQFSQARPLLEESLEIRRATLGNEHVDVVESLVHVSNVYADEADWPRAAQLAQEAYDLSAKVRGPDHPETIYRLNNLGIFTMRSGDLAAAEPILQRSLEERRRLLGEEHTGTAHAYVTLANLQRDQGKYDQAAETYARAVDVTRSVYGEDHPRLASVLNNLARLRHRQGRWAEAEAGYREALRIRRIVYGDDNPRLVPSLGSLASLLTELARFGEADSLNRVALEIARATWDGSNEQLGVALRSLGALEVERGRLAEADSLLTEALQVMDSSVGRDHVEWAQTALALSTLRLRQGRFEEARILADGGLDTYRDCLPEGHPWIALAHVDRAAALRGSGRLDDAARDLDEAVRILDAWQGDGPDDGVVELRLQHHAFLRVEQARLARDQGNLDEARRHYAAALELQAKLLPAEHPRRAELRRELDELGP